MTTVFDYALDWAENNFEKLEGEQYDSDTLFKKVIESLPDDSLESKRWVFIYSPCSLTPFFEVGQGNRLIVAAAKLATVAANGGMILFADFSANWATPKCVGKYTPIAVVRGDDAINEMTEDESDEILA